MGDQQHPLGLSQIARRSKECLEPQKPSECGHFLSFPIYSSASESMQKVEGLVPFCAEFTKEEEKWKEMRESTEKSKKEKDGHW